MFGIGEHGLKVFKDDNGKFGVGKSKEFVPQYSFDTKDEAEQYIKEHWRDIISEG
jgi:hypothetical protein